VVVGCHFDPLESAIAMTIDHSSQDTMWAHCVRFGSCDEIIEAIADQGEQANQALRGRPCDAHPKDRSCFEVVWNRIERERGADPASWARVAQALAAAVDCVNKTLSSGRLPLAQMSAWGHEFEPACQAFVEAGANCWKKDLSRLSAADATARRGSRPVPPWLQKALSQQNRLDTDSAKIDLHHNDVGFGRPDRSSSLDEWERRFAWEALHKKSTFDLECAWKLTRLFSPAQALEVWRKSLGAVEAAPLAAWAFGCVRAGLEGFPPPSDLSSLIGNHGAKFSALLGQQAVEAGNADGSSKDPERSAALIEALMAACEACAVDFQPAAQVFASQARSWTLPDMHRPDPYADAFVGEQLLLSLQQAQAEWEREILFKSSAHCPAPARSKRL
jgi:hypothetical protein